MMKKIIYIDMDDVLCDFSAAFCKSLAENPDIFEPHNQASFFKKLIPIQKSIESLEYLQSQDLFDVYILTAPFEKNPSCYIEKREWVEDYLGMEMVNRLILSPHKELLKGDYLIDDNAYGSGQELFEGTLLQFGTEQFPDWDTVVDYFKMKYRL